MRSTHAAQDQVPRLTEWAEPTPERTFELMESGAPDMRRSITLYLLHLLGSFLWQCPAAGQDASSKRIVPSTKLLEDVDVLQRVYEAATSGTLPLQHKAANEGALRPVAPSSPAIGRWPRLMSPSRNSSPRSSAGTPTPTPSISPGTSSRPSSPARTACPSASVGSGAG